MTAIWRFFLLLVKTWKLFLFFSFLILSLQTIMQEKSCFLSKLLGLFNIYGAKTLTMDDIAKEFCMSKKTLYQKYRNKEDLLAEVLTFIADRALEEIEDVKKLYDCPIQVFLEAGVRIDSLTQSEKNAFVIQLLKYYPDVFNQHQKTVYTRIMDTLKSNYEKGLELGLYREDVPMEMFIRFFAALTFSVKVSPIFEDVDINKASFSHHLKLFYLNAIVTDKGNKILKDLNTQSEPLD